jgi:hypothetical protein
MPLSALAHADERSAAFPCQSGGARPTTVVSRPCRRSGLRRLTKPGCVFRGSRVLLSSALHDAEQGPARADRGTVLPEDNGERRVWLKSSAADGERLCDATNLVIRGEGYANEEEAAREGERWRDVISRALARVHLAADFGDRKPFGTLTTAGEAWYSEQVGHPVLGDRPARCHGLCGSAGASLRRIERGGLHAPVRGTKPFGAH